MRIEIASQPLGVSYDPQTGQFVIAEYFEPQVCLGKLRQDGDDIVMDMKFVKGAEGTTRLFPDFFKKDFNRMQVAYFDGAGNLCVLRNSDRKIFVISPPETEGGRWRFLNEEISFPDDVEEGTMVHSLLLRGDNVHTVESNVKCDAWTINEYAFADDNTLERASKEDIGAFRYGIARQEGSDRLWTITDFRATERKGIYHDGELVIPGLCGNGIAFDPDGNAIVTQYGHSIEKPGALVFVPAHMFS
ncbi:MAG: hypothetical protein AAB534_00240 [Patescibacteria group bacterium]